MSGNMNLLVRDSDGKTYGNYVTQTTSGPWNDIEQPPRYGFLKWTPPMRAHYQNTNLAQSSTKQPPVHGPILDSLRDVAFGNRLLRCQIRNRPRNFQDSVMRPST
jgi:hypothetical protein